MKIVIYSHQGGEILSGVHSDITLDFTSSEYGVYVYSNGIELIESKIIESSIKDSKNIIPKTRNKKTKMLLHYISCEGLDTIGIWRTSELDYSFISACKGGKPLFMLVPDTLKEEGELPKILKAFAQKNTATIKL